MPGLAMGDGGGAVAASAPATPVVVFAAGAFTVSLAAAVGLSHDATPFVLGLAAGSIAGRAGCRADVAGTGFAAVTDFTDCSAGQMGGAAGSVASSKVAAAETGGSVAATALGAGGAIGWLGFARSGCFFGGFTPAVLAAFGAEAVARMAAAS